MPIVTAASTPETPMAIAGRYAKYPLMSERVIASAGSLILRRTWRTTKPTPSPTAIPPTTLSAKLPAASLIENDPLTTAMTANL